MAWAFGPIQNTAGGLKVIGEAHIPGLGVTAKEPMYRAIHTHPAGGIPSR